MFGLFHACAVVNALCLCPIYVFFFFFTAAEYNYVTRINLHFIFFGENVYKSRIQQKKTTPCQLPAEEKRNKSYYSTLIWIKVKKPTTFSALKYSIQSYVKDLIPDLLSEKLQDAAASTRGLVKVAVKSRVSLKSSVLIVSPHRRWRSNQQRIPVKVILELLAVAVQTL